MSKLISALGASAFLAMSGIAPATSATTIDTYDFTQGGYVGLAGTGDLTGSFTGAVESDGFIELADLSSMSVTFTVTGGGALSSDALPLFFSFDTAGGSSSLDLITNLVTTPLPVSVCVGAAAVLGASGCGAGGFDGVFFPFTTQDFPVVTLVSSVTTPESPTWVMMLLGFAGLAFAGHRGTRRGAPVAG
jgi:hypothetical protein